MTDVIQVNGYDSQFEHGDADRSLLFDRGENEVDELMRNQEFRDEVGEIVQQQIQKSVLAPPNNTTTEIPSHQQQVACRTVIPISDIRGVDTLNYRKGEKVLRCKLASCYRLLDIYPTTQGGQAYVADTYISMRNGPEQLLISPRGLLYSEVTASSLMKVNTTAGGRDGVSGVVVDEGSTSLEPDQDEILLHAVVYTARQDINCVIHIANISAVMVSVMKCGLLPLCYEAMILGDNIAYIDYSGSAADRHEADEIRRALTDNCQVLFLRNFGVVVVGETVEEAYKIASNVTTACDTQVSIVAVGIENLHIPSKEIVQTAYTLDRDIPAGVDPSRQWNYGEMEFDGLMRRLDSEGYCTGHIYHDSAGLKLQHSVSATDYTSGKTSVLDDRASGIATPLSMLLMRGKRPEWVVSPNTYKKDEQDVVDSVITGGSLKGRQHKKVYRWVSTDEEKGVSNRPKLRSASLKAVSPNKFAPQGRNPNELREKVKEIRKEYFDDTITAGPQSTVLEGVTWEEARRIKEGQQMANGVDNIRVTAASRGVIQREHQRDALFYKKYTLNNPFDNVTQEDLDKYKSEVMKKSKKSTYGKYAESEPEFLSESRRPITPIRPTTPPAKPARMSPIQTDIQPFNTGPGSHVVDESELKAGSNKPVLATQPQPRPALSTQNQSDHNIVVNKETDLPKRSQSARYPNERRPDIGNRSVLLDEPVGHSSTLDHRSSKENSPVQDGSLTKDKKKKRGLRLPSFSKKKEKQ